MGIITQEDYRIVREKLSSNKPKIAKTGIQDFIVLLEQNRRFPGMAILEKRDFQAKIMSLLENEDEDIRKWTYHLLCLQPLDDGELIAKRCAQNIKLELECENIENISWITAVNAVNSRDFDQFNCYLSSYSIRDFLTPNQLKLSASAFRVEPYYEIESKLIFSALDEENPISPIWLTKTFANQYLPAIGSRRTTPIQINMDAFASLLHHPHPDVRKYTMWAFAQEQNGNIASVWKYMPLSDAMSQENGILKWYLVKAFQDLDFLRNNPDFVSTIKNSLKGLDKSVREGILIGSKKQSWHQEKLPAAIEDLIVNWESAAWEVDENIRLRLYEFIVKNSASCHTFRDILNYVKHNLDYLDSENIKQYFQQLAFTEERVAIVNNYYGNINGANVQVNFGGTNTQVVNPDVEKEISKFAKNLEKLQEEIKNRDPFTDDQITRMTDTIMYELNRYGKKALSDDVLQNVSDRLKAIQEAAPTKRKANALDFLSALANLTTVASATPDFISFISKTIQTIQNLF